MSDQETIAAAGSGYAGPACSAGRYFPRTLVGWRTLFWVTLRRCPKCKGRMVYDPWAWVAEDIVYCMPCGGAMLPRGFIRALLFNKRATSKQNKEVSVER